jgi:hypothetical protein
MICLLSVRYTSAGWKGWVIATCFVSGVVCGKCVGISHWFYRVSPKVYIRQYSQNCNFDSNL